MMYMRFILCLGFGLFGLAAVLKMLIDLVLQDCDPVAELQHFVAEASGRRRYVTLLNEDDEETDLLSWQQSRHQYAHQEPSALVRIPEKITVRE
jgi:hypothetical protein